MCADYVRLFEPASGEFGLSCVWVYEVGAILGAKYRVDHQIARGGMGVILAATHLTLGVPVALKFLREDLAKNPQVVERFVREAKAAAQLRCDNVCRVSDVDEHDGVPFIVMELLSGRDLASVVKTAPLDEATAAGYVLQACVAVAEAHALGIIHRDLKPANLYLTYRTDGTPLIKVLDFGVAKAPAGTDDHSITQTQNVMGSPGYMSPEQLRSTKTVDLRTDIWSLGITLYELVVGERPWTAETVTALAVKVNNEPPAPMPSYVSAAYADVVMRCLRKDPDQRYPSVAELAAALAPFAPESGTRLAAGVTRTLGSHPRAITGSRTPAGGVKVGGGDMPTTLRTATGSIEPVAARGRRWPIGVAIGAVVAGAAVLAVTLLRTNHREATPASTVPPPEVTEVTEIVEPPPLPDAAVAPVVATDASVEVVAPPPEVASQEPAPVAKPVKPVKPAKSVKPSKGGKKKPTLEDIRDSRM
jgi:serine/threonine-protein kinase